MEWGGFGMRVESFECGWKICNEGGKFVMRVVEIYEWGCAKLDWGRKIRIKVGKFGMKTIWNMEYLEWGEFGKSCIECVSIFICSYFWSSTFLFIQKIDRNEKYIVLWLTYVRPCDFHPPKNVPNHYLEHFYLKRRRSG